MFLADSTQSSASLAAASKSSLRNFSSIIFYFKISTAGIRASSIVFSPTLSALPLLIIIS